MPVISRFNGIVIKMYFRQKEHNPPHIHAIYGECIGLFEIENGKMFEGDIPLKERKLVEIFVKRNKSELLDMWNSQVFRTIEM